MPFLPTSCPRCLKPFKDARGLGLHTRKIHPEAVADKPILQSSKAEARELAADADLQDYKSEGGAMGQALPTEEAYASPQDPQPETLIPEIKNRLPSPEWLQRNYPQTTLPPNHVMCELCNTDSYPPEPLAARMCFSCRKFHA